MAKTPAELEKEIKQFLANPKLGDPAWEQAWADLLREKHSKARVPTIDELARAYSYVLGQFAIKGGVIDAEQWAEGLVFGQRHGIDREARRQAEEALKQLSHASWLRIAERANYIAQQEGEPQRYLK